MNVRNDIYFKKLKKSKNYEKKISDGTEDFFSHVHRQETT